MAAKDVPGGPASMPAGLLSLGEIMTAARKLSANDLDLLVDCLDAIRSERSDSERRLKAKRGSP
jgi:hypothetical protein